MVRIEKQPLGVPNFIWIIYEETWKRYNAERATSVHIASYGGAMTYEISMGKMLAELALLEKIMRHFTVTSYHSIEDLFEHHRAMDRAAGVPITTEGLNGQDHTAA